MTKEFLEKLGIEAEAINKILAENQKDTAKEAAKTTAAQEKLVTVQADFDALKQSSGDAAAIQQKYDEAKAKYEADIADLGAKLAARDYDDAIRAGITSAGVKFSSKAAERDFMAIAREKKMELKNGILTGLDDLVKAQKEADPGAFAPEKAAPRFMGPTGTGGAPSATLPPNVQQAKEMAEARANTTKAANDALKSFI